MLVDAAKQERAADGAVVKRLLERGVLRVVHAHQPDLHQLPAARRLRVEDPPRVLEADAEGLLAQHRLAGLDTGDGERRMGRVRRRDDDRVDGAVTDQLGRVREDRGVPALRGECGGPLPVHIHDRGDPRSRDPMREIAGMAPSHAPRADDPDVECPVRHCPLLPDRFDLPPGPRHNLT